LLTAQHAMTSVPVLDVSPTTLSFSTELFVFLTAMMLTVSSVLLLTIVLLVVLDTSSTKTEPAFKILVQSNIVRSASISNSAYNAKKTILLALTILLAFLRVL